MAEDQKKVVARLRVERAMEDVEAAQRLLSHAAECLSSLNYGNPTQRAVMREYDRVHALWYRVRKLLTHERVTLDHEPNHYDDGYMPQTPDKVAR